MSHGHPPSELLWAVLTASEHATNPTKAQPWPAYVGHMPEVPDNAIAFYDTAGRRDGRLMTSGENITHKGFQCRVRCKSYLEGYRKIHNIAQHLAKVKRTEVVLGTGANAAAYVIASVTLTGDILTLGREPDVKAREAFTLNGTITYREA